MKSFEIEAPPVSAHSGFITSLLHDISSMPITMRQLGWVQFFSWFGLFGMWVYSTPAIAQHIYGLAANDTHSVEYNDAGNWVGIIFGVYNLVSAIYAFLLLPVMARKWGRKTTHIVSLIAGGIGLISVFFAPNKEFLIISMVGVGMAWASILAMPYAILAGSLPASKMGIYMGIFNFFIVLPEIIASLFFGNVMETVLHNDRLLAVQVGGGLLIAAAIVCAIVVKENE